MKSHVIAAFCLVAVIACVNADKAPHAQGVQQTEQQFQPQPAQQPQFQRPQQPFRPLPYQQNRRQSAMGRMRQSIYNFFSGIMSAGSRIRQQASARIFNMFNRRSFNRRSQRQQPRPFRQQ